MATGLYRKRFLRQVSARVDLCKDASFSDVIVFSIYLVYGLLVGQNNRKTSLWTFGNCDGLLKPFSDIFQTKWLMDIITISLMNNESNYQLVHMLNFVQIRATVLKFSFLSFTPIKIRLREPTESFKVLKHKFVCWF